MELDLRSSELIKERISDVDKHFSDISVKLAAYLKNLSQVRDSGDDLAESISSFAVKEALNLSLRKSLIKFTDMLRAVQEHRDAQIQRTDAKVILEFENYKPICKLAKSELKQSFDLHTMELRLKNMLERTKGKIPTNLHKIAEREADRAQIDSMRTTLELSKRIDDFEKQKLQSIQQTFLEFIGIELMFHSKAIELYTAAYNSIKNINTEEDLKVFRNHFRSYATLSDYLPLAYDQTNVANNKGVNSNSEASKTFGHLTMSNSGFKASLESGELPSTPNTTSSKRVQRTLKNDTLNRPNHSVLENQFAIW